MVCCKPPTSVLERCAVIALLCRVVCYNFLCTSHRQQFWATISRQIMSWEHSPSCFVLVAATVQQSAALSALSFVTVADGASLRKCSLYLRFFCMMCECRVSCHNIQNDQEDPFFFLSKSSRSGSLVAARSQNQHKATRIQYGKSTAAAALQAPVSVPVITVYVWVVGAQ